MHRHFGKFYLRVPAYPMSKINIVSADLLDFARHVSGDEYFMAGILLASPVLHAEVLKIKEIETLDKNSRKIAYTLLKYWLRICHRCTPYGLFSGCSLGAIDNETNLLLDDLKNCIRHVKLDTTAVMGVKEALLLNPKIRNQIKYRPNNTLYKLGNSYRYIELLTVSQKRKYSISEFITSADIENLLSAAGSGLTIPDMVKMLCDAGYEMADATNFIEELVTSYILISDLDISITGQDPLSFIIERINLLSGVDDIISDLKSLKNRISTFTCNDDLSNEIRRVLTKIGSDRSFQTDSPLQIDLYLSPCACTLDKNLINDIATNSIALFRLTPQYLYQQRLEAFKASFRNRYDGQEISLNIALDPDVGIGYDNYDRGELLAGANLRELRPQTNMKNIMQSDTDRLCITKLLEFYDKKYDHIELTEMDLKDFGVTRPLVLPESLSIKGSLLRKGEGPIDLNNYHFLLNSCHGPGASNLLGRFCGGSEDVKEFAMELNYAEEQLMNEAIFAEISHMPQEKTGNISQRPNLREFEIPYVSPSSLPAERQIPVADIVVKIENDRVILRSKRFNKRIFPRLSSAENYRRSSLPLFNFLCDLQYQGYDSSAVWNWGVLSKEVYLPRVVYKNIIVSRARWLLSMNLFTRFSSNLDDFIKEFKKIRSKYKIPKFVQLCESDNELFVDTDNSNCLSILLDYLKKKPTVLLVENLQTPDRAIVKDIKGDVFNNEIVIPLLNTDSNVIQERLHKKSNIISKRIFPPGSEWLYVKIYSSPKSAEKLLKELIKPYVEKLIVKNSIDNFFFIRYQDPEFHLRLRFHGSNKFWVSILSTLEKKLRSVLNEGVVYRMQTDTYIREIERYGDQTIEFAEEVFCMDSIFVIKILPYLDADNTNESRWLIALKCMDSVFGSFNFDTKTKLEICASVLLNNQPASTDSIKFNPEIDKKYREYCKQIRDHLQNRNDNLDDNYQVISRHWTNRMQSFFQAFSKLDSSIKKGPNENLFHNLAVSFVHMLLNRLLVIGQKETEIFLYGMLKKYYSSEYARVRYQAV